MSSKQSGDEKWKRKIAEKDQRKIAAAQQPANSAGSPGVASTGGTERENPLRKGDIIHRQVQTMGDGRKEIQFFYFKDSNDRKSWCFKAKHVGDPNGRNFEVRPMDGRGVVCFVKKGFNIRSWTHFRVVDVRKHTAIVEAMAPDKGKLFRWHESTFGGLPAKPEAAPLPVPAPTKDMPPAEEPKPAVVAEEWGADGPLS